MVGITAWQQQVPLRQDFTGGNAFRIPRNSVFSDISRARVRFILARVYGERERNFTGQHFWARGYFASTVGRDEAVIREYIRNQEKEDERLDQLKLQLQPATVQVAQENRGRASVPSQPLRAAHKTKPPALPGGYFARVWRRCCVILKLLI
jgi:hypothetical protein